MRPHDPRPPSPSASGPTHREAAQRSSGDGDCLRLALVRQQHRRAAYRAGRLQVWWNGRARRCVDPHGDPFHVPLSVSSLNLVGEDADGLLLLAVVPLPAPEEVAPDGARHLTVTLEGGQTVALTIARGTTTSGRRRAYVIQLTYTDPPTAETLGPVVDRMPAQVAALGAEVDRLQARAVQFFADVERLQTRARALAADVGRLQEQAFALHRDQLHVLALRAQVKDMLQRLLQLSAETPWGRRDEGDHEGPGPEAPPPEGPSRERPANQMP
jgi:hypothetical protein